MSLRIHLSKNMSVPQRVWELKCYISGLRSGVILIHRSKQVIDFTRPRPTQISVLALVITRIQAKGTKR